MSARQFIRAVTIASLCAVPWFGGAPAQAQSLFGWLRFGYDGSDAPGGPRSPTAMSRRLLEDGYELQAPMVQDGAVYFAKVVQAGRPLCLMLDLFTGTILQTFAYTPAGLIALNTDSPGPGYPGYPPFPDGRYAQACASSVVVAQAPAPPAIVKQTPKPRLKPRRRIFRRRRIKPHIRPACGPYSPSHVKKAAHPVARRPATAQPTVAPKPLIGASICHRPTA